MRFLLFCFATILLASCEQENANQYSLEGNALGFADGTKVFVYNLDGNKQPNVTDTLEITGETFKATYPKKEETAVQLLRVDGTKNNIIFFSENENLKVNIYKDSLSASRVLGGKQNELYSEYNKTIGRIGKRKAEINAEYRVAQQQQDGILITELRNENIALTTEEKAFKRKFVRENANSLFGMMLLTELFGKEEMTASETSQILEQLSPKLKASEMVANLKKTIEAKKKADVGGMAPAFSAPTPDGNMLSLNEALGKYTIIDFWASWCRPCRMENPNVVKVYNKYHDKGLNIISVSLDKAGQAERWKKAIADDKMDWYHVSNLQFWQDPIARQYNVRSIPATFLLDEKGTIIDKNLRGPALEAKIASLLE